MQAEPLWYPPLSSGGRELPGSRMRFGGVHAGHLEVRSLRYVSRETRMVLPVDASFPVVGPEIAGSQPSARKEVMLMRSCGWIKQQQTGYRRL